MTRRAKRRLHNTDGSPQCWALARTHTPDLVKGLELTLPTDITNNGETFEGYVNRVFKAHYSPICFEGFPLLVGKRVVVGSDDVYPAARFAVEYLRRKGFEVIPLGSVKTERPEPWPRVAIEAASMVARGDVDWGVLVCYTGTGVSIAANKVRGVRAALCNDAQTARGARLWNDANILAMSGRLVTGEVAREIIDAWLSVESIDPSEKDNIRFLEEFEVERG